jgi:serine protease Do
VFFFATGFSLSTVFSTDARLRIQSLFRMTALSLFLPMPAALRQVHPGVMATDLINLSNQLAGAVEKASAGIVAVHARPRIGSSGVIWRQNFILTSSEGIRAEEGIKVLFPDGRVADARLQGRDSGTDLALLETDTGTLAPAAFTSDATLKAGQLILAVGRTANTGPIASFGIISGVAGEWQSWRGGRLDPFVRLDVAVYPTSSGGAVVDATGSLLGLVSTGLSRSSVLAVTAKTIDRVATRLQEKGHMSRPYLGISLQPVTLPRDLKEKFKLTQDTGIMILGIEPDSPAAAAGLILGDVLIAGGGETLSDPEVLATVLNHQGSGATVAFRVLRAGDAHEVSIKLGERPSRNRK